MLHLIDPRHARACFLAFATLSSSPAWTANVDARARLLASANLALMFGNVCEAQAPGFISQIIGKDGDVRSYAQAIKDEVSAGLNRGTVMTILKSAGDTAKRRALTELRGLRDPGTEPDDQILRTWCNITVHQSIRRFINLNDDPASEFSRLREAGKQLQTPVE